MSRKEKQAVLAWLQEQEYWDLSELECYLIEQSELMRELLKMINQGLTPEEWKVTCHLFAPYAPEENPIEAVWLSLKNLLRRCYRFCKNFTLMKRLFKCLVDFKLFTFPNIKKYDAFSCLI